MPSSLLHALKAWGLEHCSPMQIPDTVHLAPLIGIDSFRRLSIFVVAL